jgi:hypothetical protein
LLQLSQAVTERIEGPRQGGIPESLPGRSGSRGLDAYASKVFKAMPWPPDPILFA